MNPTVVVDAPTIPDATDPANQFDPQGDLTETESSQPSGPAVSRIVVWAVAIAMSALLLLSGQPLAMAPALLALAVMLASAIASSAGISSHSQQRSLTVVGAVPAGFMLLALSGLVVGLAAGAVGIPVWTGRLGSLGAAGALALGSGAICRRRGGTVELLGRDWPAFVGAAGLAAFFVWVLVSQPLALWSRMMSSGTDFLRHVKMVREVHDAGVLEPGAVTYPRALHGLGAWLVGAMGLPTDTDTLWRAIQPIVLLMLVVLLLAVMASATRATDLSLRRPGWPGVAAGTIAGLAFVQTAWFSTFLDFGNVMNMLVAIALLALLVTGLTVEMRSFTAACVAGGAVALTANSWQLLVPVAFVGCVPWAFAFLRRCYRDLGLWLTWSATAAITINGLLAARTTSVAGATAMPTVSNLFSPDWWWFVALALAMAVGVLAVFRGRVAWALSALGMVVGVVLLTAYLFKTSGSTWELMLYYPVKAMWTGMIVILPLASAGGAAVVAGAWNRASHREGWMKLSVELAIVSLVALTAVGVAGRGAAFRPHLAGIAAGEAGLPNWPLAVIDTFDRQISGPESEGAIVMGVVPATTVDGVTTGFVGMADYMAMEALDHLGAHQAYGSPVKLDLASRNSERICLYLKTYPSSLRLTGPNRAAGPDWLLKSGCPASVVQPERWISLQFDDEWLANSRWEDRTTWAYPTVAEVAAATKRLAR